MDSGLGAPPRRYTALDPCHQYTTLFQSKPADVPRVLDELRTRGGDYVESAFASMLLGCNALNEETNVTKMAVSELQQEVQLLREQSRLGQVEHLDLAAAAQKREKELRLDVFKDKQVKREVATLIDLEYLTKDADKVLESIWPGQVDDVLKGRVSVPSGGYHGLLSPAMIDQIIAGLAENHVRTRRRIFDQIRALEAGAKSHVGFGIIPFLQPNWDYYHSGTLEDKEAFSERVKAAEKQYKAEKTAAQDGVKKRKGGGGGFGSGPRQPLLGPAAATISARARRTQNTGGGGGRLNGTGPAAVISKKKLRCRLCKKRGHLADTCSKAKAGGTG